MPATPVFDWDAQQYARFYRVLVSEDADFTNIAHERRDERVATGADGALRESSAGGSYYWYVIPCRGGTLASPSTCGPSPQSVSGLPGVKQFRKVSPPSPAWRARTRRAPTSPSPGQDYFTTNQATLGQGETGNESARTYRIQVDTEPSFSAPLLDTAEVDQTTYTAPVKLYPEGTLYWRVQALDSGRSACRGRPPASLTKSSPAVAPTSPGNGAVVAGTVPFTWAPQPFASSYTIEVYKNNDAAFSRSTGCSPRRSRTAAYAWSQPFRPATRPTPGGSAAPTRRQRRSVVADHAA